LHPRDGTTYAPGEYEKEAKPYDGGYQVHAAEHPEDVLVLHR
jgi:hypothetical protein